MLVLLVVGVVAFWDDDVPAAVAGSSVPANAIPLAVLGDSTSHSYQDLTAFPPGTPLRGGKFHARTFQWTEVLARLRGNEIDLGPWVAWGQPGGIAFMRESIGLPTSRAPRKEDYLYNFANSGAACKNLMGERLGQRFRQVPRLVALMNREPERWRRGVVVIYMGGNNWNGWLDLQSRDPLAAELRETIDYCTQQIRAAITLIHASHPSTRILLVGLVNQADDPENLAKYRSSIATANIKKSLANANAELRKIAEADRQRITFADINDWFSQRWGERSPNGDPDYNTVTISPGLRVTNTGGDSPSHTVLSDGHWGVVPNAIWAQSFVAQLREAFGLPLTPISNEELARFLAG
ncbi:SGNH/GDSL hydrolase family protein [Variovorax sp. PBL-H6]|uniref:SGNH/GDSL hydrolase family protein n=1 Tax=Variovorax sp. PBL-H6 TaxID=434009 RepID=UPI0013A5AFA1|nr:SGNH/GDSL hydrolase family protein [Variovorax sp. PBL-H6]